MTYFLIGIILGQIIYWLIIHPITNIKREEDKKYIDICLYLVNKTNLPIGAFRRQEGETDRMYKKRMIEIYNFYKDSEVQNV